MQMPHLLKETLIPLKKIVGNVNDIALLNILNAKVVNMIAQNHMMFKQSSHEYPTALSYYAMCFLDSGSSKDYTVNCINNYLMPFVEKELDKRIEAFRNELESKLDLEDKLGQKKILDDLEKVRVSAIELGNPNITGLFREAEQINKLDYGSLFIRIGELGDYLGSVVGGDKSKKELFEKLKELYDGEFKANVIAGEGNRKNLHNIPIQVLLYSDFENLLKGQAREYYLRALKTGMARRSFCYCEKEQVKLSMPVEPEIKDEAIAELLRLQKEYKKVFDILNAKKDKIYNLSEEAKKAIKGYKCECTDFYNNSNQDKIIKIERLNSFWKITKLAVAYGILEEPQNCLIAEKYVNMAIDFYKAISPCLENIITNREKSEVEKFAEFLAGKEGQIVTKTDLRKTKIFSDVKFKKEFDRLYEDIRTELYETYKLVLCEYEPPENTPRCNSTKAFQIVRKG